MGFMPSRIKLKHTSSLELNNSGGSVEASSMTNEYTWRSSTRIHQQGAMNKYSIIRIIAKFQDVDMFFYTTAITQLYAILLGLRFLLSSGRLRGFNWDWIGGR